MCEHNVEISTRKKVLRLVHDMALEKAKTGFNSGSSKERLEKLMVDWIDELAKSHSSRNCVRCGHEFS